MGGKKQLKFYFPQWQKGKEKLNTVLNYKPDLGSKDSRKYNHC